MWQLPAEKTKKFHADAEISMLIHYNDWVMTIFVWWLDKAFEKQILKSAYHVTLFYPHPISFVLSCQKQK